MITRGIITYSDSSKLKVYIPILDGKVDQKDLNNPDMRKRYQGTEVSSVVSWPGFSPTYIPGDVVMVGFEDNEASSPVVLGYLQSSISDRNQKISLAVEDLSIKGELKSSTDVTFGDNVLNFNEIFNSSKGNSVTISQGHDSYESGLKLIVTSSNGGVFKKGEVSTILTATVWLDYQDVTDLFTDSQFRWTRVSQDTQADLQWNQDHFGGSKSITVTSDDIYVSATFFCDLVNLNTQKSLLKK